MYAVYVKDRISDQEVCVGDMLSRVEASELRRVLSKYQACEVYILEFYYEKGRYVEK